MNAFGREVIVIASAPHHRLTTEWARPSSDATANDDNAITQIRKEYLVCNGEKTKPIANTPGTKLQINALRHLRHFCNRKSDCEILSVDSITLHHVIRAWDHSLSCLERIVAVYSRVVGDSSLILFLRL